jgi:hypothetical protein
MAIRIVELFRLGGFRLAVARGVFGLDWPEGYAVLERTVAEFAKDVLAMPYTRLVPPHQEDFPERPGPRLGDREGFVDGVVSPPEADGTVRLLVRGSFGMKGWPLGYWVVWTGYRLSPSGTVSLLSDEELSSVW